jgi:hypothetical protein
MKILFDNGTPKPIARCLTGHEITYARQIGWHELENGELIQKAEEAGYEVLLSTDKNIRYQQNLSGRKIALVVLGNQQWPAVRLHLDRIAAVVNAAAPGSYTEVNIPFEYPPRPCFSVEQLSVPGMQTARTARQPRRFLFRAPGFTPPTPSRHS